MGSIRSGILAEALRLSGLGGMHSVAVTFAPMEERLLRDSGWPSGFDFALVLSHPGGYPAGSISSREGKCGKAEWPCGCPVCPCGCTGCMCLPTAPGAISGRASGVQALQASHPGSRYPGWCTVVQRCQEWLGKAGTSPARLETRTKESIGGRRQCCACSQSW